MDQVEAAQDQAQYFEKQCTSVKKNISWTIFTDHALCVFICVNYLIV